ncbi:hypothetical protein SASPL_126614 [Salvia splendens]|uniref:Uncharacterized protein n=1 Tax=Salvia splendens TaxID=180675 RepID=A0A8X8XJ76_SALSN|nr:hypothetical protein SASPL_126614 [Salvia splendens]
MMRNGLGEAGGVRDVVDRSVLNQKRWIAFLDRVLREETEFPRRKERRKILATTRKEMKSGGAEGDAENSVSECGGSWRRMQQVEARRVRRSHSGKVVRMKKDGFDSRRGKKIHAQLVLSGLSANLYAMTSLMNLYANANGMPRRVLDLVAGVKEKRSRA